VIPGNLHQPLKALKPDVKVLAELFPSSAPAISRLNKRLQALDRMLS
jgi:hypothetical protein